MKRTPILAAAMLSTWLAFSSCSEDAPQRMIWKFSDYDRMSVSAAYSKDLIYQMDIVAIPDYEGTITLKCSNYRQLDIIQNYIIGSPENQELGYSASMTDDNTLMVSFQRVESFNVYNAGFIQIEGRSGDKTNWSTISILRVTL